MPPIDATWRGVGATSAGSDQMLAAANARLPYEMPKNVSIQYTLDVNVESEMADDISMPPTMQVLRAAVRLQPRRKSASETSPPIHPPGIAINAGIMPSVPSDLSEKPRVCTR